MKDGRGPLLGENSKCSPSTPIARTREVDVFRDELIELNSDGLGRRIRARRTELFGWARARAVAPMSTPPPASRRRVPIGTPAEDGRPKRWPRPAQEMEPPGGTVTRLLPVA